MKHIRWLALVLTLLLSACASAPGVGVSGVGVVQSISEATEASQTGAVMAPSAARCWAGGWAATSAAALAKRSRPQPAASPAAWRAVR